MRGQRILRTQKAMLEAQMQRQNQKDLYERQLKEGKKIKEAAKTKKAHGGLAKPHTSANLQPAGRTSRASIGGYRNNGV